MAADRGSIWTVPAAGPGARCLVVSGPRGVARGRPEYQVIPVYPLPANGPAVLDFVVHEGETTLGETLVAAIWNLRPILAADLGERVGEVIDDSVLLELRDAVLRQADPTIRVASGRLGSRELAEAETVTRDLQMQSWHRLTGRALADLRQVQAPRGRPVPMSPIALAAREYLTAFPGEGASARQSARERGHTGPTGKAQLRLFASVRLGGSHGHSIVVEPRDVRLRSISADMLFVLRVSSEALETVRAQSFLGALLAKGGRGTSPAARRVAETAGYWGAIRAFYSQQDRLISVSDDTRTTWALRSIGSGEGE